MVSAGVLIAGGGAAVAAGVDPWSLLPTDSPTALFVFNPAVPNTPPPGFTGTTYPAVPNPPTPVIASSVSDIGTVNIAGVGPFQYWVARTQNGRWCQAFRAPNGTWAGTTHGSDPTYSFGGEVPGCVPGVPEGSPLASLQEGFDPQTDSITPAGAAFDASTFILFGTYDNPGGQATTVVDTIDGMSTPLLDGH